MLSPEQIEAAGDAVAAIYNDIEAKMLNHMVDALISMDNLDQRTMTELVLLSQSQTATLSRYIEQEADSISAEVRDTAERLLKASDEDDLKRLGEGSPIYPQQVSATIQGVAEILARDNLKMVEGAKQAFLTASTEAITRVNTGTMTTERALHSAVRKLERDGIPIITYQNSKTGMVTVENKVDVAVRRHIRTQIAQDGARMTMERIERGECTLVEVSSHEDSRPSHAAWQGQVYSLNGDVEIDGYRYRDFYEATRYGSVDGLLGANCRHSFGPYRHGAPRAYEENPKHPSGLDGAEVYELEQQQRYLERRIREAKRELRGAQQLYDAKPEDLGRKTALIKAQNTLKERQAAIRDLIEEANAKSKRPGVDVLHRKPNREWAGDMPKSKPLGASGRKLDDFLGGPGATNALKTNGISKSAARKALAEEMAKRGGTAADFASLSAKDQQGIFKRIVSALRNPAKVKGAKHAAKTAIDRNAPVYSKLETKHVDKIAQLVGNSTTAASRLYLRYEGDLSLIDHEFKRTDHFDRERVGVFLNASRAYRDQRGSMVTWFHEFGHHIDYIATGSESFSVKRSNGMTLANSYASIRYKGNAFGDTLKREANEYIEARHKQIKDKAMARAKAMDLQGLYADGMLSDATLFVLDGSNCSAKEALRTIKSDPMFKDALKKDRAYEAVSKEIGAMTDAQSADLSDIFGGATRNKVKGGWGHRTAYWDSNNMALAREAFAEFYSAHISNPDSLAVLKQYLPESARTFEDIIEAIEKGTI